MKIPESLANAGFHAVKVSGDVPPEVMKQLETALAALPYLIRALENLLEYAWGDWKDDTMRDEFCRGNPGHPITAAEWAIARAKGDV